MVLGGVQGSRRSVLTNGFGRFRFDDVTVGETYTIDVRAKGLMFRSRLITVTEDVTGLGPAPETTAGTPLARKSSINAKDCGIALRRCS